MPRIIWSMRSELTPSKEDVFSGRFIFLFEEALVNSFIIMANPWVSRPNNKCKCLHIIRYPL